MLCLRAKYEQSYECLATPSAHNGTGYKREGGSEGEGTVNNLKAGCKVRLSLGKAGRRQHNGRAAGDRMWSQDTNSMSSAGCSRLTSDHGDGTAVPLSDRHLCKYLQLAHTQREREKAVRDQCKQIRAHNELTGNLKAQLSLRPVDERCAPRSEQHFSRKFTVAQLVPHTVSHLSVVPFLLLLPSLSTRWRCINHNRFACSTRNGLNN